MKNWKVIVLLVLAVVISNQLEAQGCSQCRLMAEQGSELDEASFGSNINGGILYLMILPYLLVMFLFRKQLLKFFRSVVKH